jgi:hypothetical protein
VRPKDLIPFDAPKRRFTGGRFSLRYVFTIVTGIAAGLAMARTEAFNIYDALFFIPAVIIVIGLVSESAYLRRQRRRAVGDASSLMFHAVVRIALALTILVAYAMQGLIEYIPRGTEIDMFESGVSTPSLLAQTAVFCSIMLSVPARQTVETNRFGRLVCIIVFPVFVLLVLLNGWMLIVVLVDLAIESIEALQPPSLYVGGGMYAGLDRDLQQRTTTFAFASALGMIPVALLIVAIAWIVRHRQESLTRQTWAVAVLLLVATVYPIWLYSIGLSQYCPPFAIAGLANSWISIVCGVLAALVLSSNMSFRLAWRAEHINVAQAPPVFAHRSIVTDLFWVGAGVVWSTAGAFDSQGLYEYGWMDVASVILDPSRFIAIAIAILVVSRLTGKLVRSRPTIRAGFDYQVVDLHRFCLLCPTIALTFLLGAPAITWFTYSLLRLGLGW